MTWELLKNIGSVGGLFAALFIIWDRVLRGRPLMFITGEPVGANVYTSLKIENVSPVSILIKKIDVWPARFAISRGHSIDAVMRAAARDTFVHTLGAGGKVAFPIIKHSVWPRREPRVTFFILWWRTTNSTWLPRWPHIIATTPESIESIEEGCKEIRD